MPEHPQRVREVAWQELFPWLILTRSVRIALLARVILLGAIGIIATTSGWQVIGTLFPAGDDPVLSELKAEADAWIWEDSPGFQVAMSARSAPDIFRSAREGLSEAPVSLWVYFTRPFMHLFRDDVTPRGFLYLLVTCVWELLVWGLIGGAITRIAALKFTRDEGPGFSHSLRHSASKLMSYTIAPLIALAGASVFALQLVVLGLVMRLEVVTLIAALAWPFVLLLGLLMAILLIGALLGWPLMWSTVSVEGTDAFDALSRSYAYVYQRPLRLLWYVLFAALLAALSMFVVKAFAATAIALGDWSISWGLDQQTMDTVVSPGTAARRLEAARTNGALTGEVDTVSLQVAVGADDDPDSTGEPQAGGPEFPAPGDSTTPSTGTTGDAAPSTLDRIARRAIHFWKSMLAALAAGYQAGFLWVSAVGIYLLLRRDIDGAEMNEVYLAHEDEFGVPPLDEDPATGVPEVSPSGTPLPGDTGTQPPG